MVAAEAAAAGSLPLVASHSGLAEIADRDRLGVPSRATSRPHELLERRDPSPTSPESSAGCWRSHAKEHDRIAQAARQAVERRWSWSSVAERLLQRFN